jgi:hypothetical protein
MVLNLGREIQTPAKHPQGQKLPIFLFSPQVFSLLDKPLANLIVTEKSSCLAKRYS